jgi:hypothetical protein
MDTALPCRFTWGLHRCLGRLRIMRPQARFLRQAGVRVAIAATTFCLNYEEPVKGIVRLSVAWASRNSAVTGSGRSLAGPARAHTLDYTAQ